MAAQSPSTMGAIMNLAYSLRQRIGQLPVFSSNKNLTPSQCFILQYLESNSDKVIYQKDIEEKLSIRKSTVTGILKNMEKNNLIVREFSESDARMRRVKETEKGSLLIEDINRDVLWLNHIIESGITESEMVTFMRVIEKMKRNMMK